MAIQDLKTSLDLKQDLNIYLKCKQFDNLNLILSIFDNSLQADLSNYNVRLRAMKADNVPLIQQHVGIDVNGNVVNIQADAQLTTTAGNTPIELQFIDKSTGEKKATFNLVLVVVASAIAIEASISKATYTLLEELENKLDQASDFLENIDTAIDANNDLIASTNTANSAKQELDSSKDIALSTKSALDASNTNATNTKNALDILKTDADNTKNALNTINQTGQTLLDSLENFEEQHADVTDISNKLANINADLSENVQQIKPTINTVTNNVLKAKDGNSLLIGCYGDSTYWGYVSGGAGAQITTPPPIALQNILQSYFNNTNITVNNHGVCGQKSDDIMSTWDTTISASSETIIYINWGINDSKLEGITPEKYRSNLRTIIETAKKYGKQVICDIPNIVLGADSAATGMGDATKNQNVKLYADIMRIVAKEYGCYIIDNYKYTQKYNYLAEYIPISMPDGMHPSEDMYNHKALQMAEPFLTPHCINVDGYCIIPCVDSSIKFYGTSATVVEKNSRSGFGLYADNIKIAINVEKPIDLYLALPMWYKGSTQCQIKIDNSIISTISLNNTYTNNKVTNMEILIAENLKQGLHFIELNKLDVSNTNYSVALEYLVTRPIKTIKKLLTGHTESNGNFTISQATHIIEKISLNNVSGTGTALLDLPTSRLIRNIDIEVTATLNSGDGFFVMGTQRTATNNTATSPYPGVILFINQTTGYLSINEGIENGYGITTALNTINYIGSNHKYRLIVSTIGGCTIYVDDVQIATYNMTQSVLGGYFGVYKATVGILNIDKVVLRQ